MTMGRWRITVLAVLLVLVASSVAEAQTECVYDYVPRAGRGPAPDGSGRRIITVHLDASWGSTSPDKIWNGTVEAIRQFNDHTDQYGNKTPYYLEIDQNYSRGFPADVTITKDNTPDIADAPGAFFGGPATVRVDEEILVPFHTEWHATALMGHEIGHTLGLARGQSGASIMAPVRTATDPNTGNTNSWISQSPGVTQEDIAAVNRAFHNSGCNINPYTGPFTVDRVDEGFGTEGGTEEEYSGGDEYQSCWTTWAVTYYLQTDQYGNWYIYDISYDYVISYDCYPIVQG